MLESWIFWSLLAASMQSVRTAGQKWLTSHITALGATLVRYLFGLPFALAYLAWLSNGEESFALEALADNTDFLICGLLAGVLQIIATVLLIRLFSLRNFAIGSTYVRSEILLTALIGTAFFYESISPLGWLAIVIAVVGLIVISIGKTGTVTSLWNRSAAYGLAAGLAFALTSLLIRRGSLSLGLEDPMLAAAAMLAYMVTLQTIISFVLVLARNPAELAEIGRRWRPSLFVGVTSVIGSAGWFTAFTLETAAYVKTLGQIEFLFTLGIALYFFKEKPTIHEWVGMLFIVVGVVVLLLAS